MSVIITVYSDRFIAMCADRQETNMETGEINKDAITKIKKWTPTIAVGSSGNKGIQNVIIDCVHNYFDEEGIENFTLEEIGDTFAQAYYAALDELPEMPRNAFANFVIGGKLSTGHLGIVSVIVGNEIADMEVYSSDLGQSLIYAPEDMTSEECNALFNKALKNTSNKSNKHIKDPFETTFRKAVGYISKESKFVSHKTDYLIITLEDFK